MSLGDIAGYEVVHGTVAVGDQPRIEALIAAASDMFQHAAGQTISLVSDDDVWLEGDDTPSLFLPETPVVSVSSVTLDGNVLVEDTDYWVDTRLGRLVRIAGCWPCGADRIEVAYSHGYSTTPADVEQIVYQLTRRMSENPSGGLMLMERLGQYEVRYQPGFTGNTLTQYEQCVAEAYSRPRLA